MSRIPDTLPLLSPGRHRRRRRGVCLMEYTSIIAGERFSDHPRCTDPVLAAIARAVNDYSTDAGRQRLAVLASELTAANGADPAIRFAIARRCLLTALPHARPERRRVLVIGLLGLDRAAHAQSRGWRPDMVTLDTEFALLAEADELTAAAGWLQRQRVTPREYLRHGLPAAVELAIATVAREADDPDEVLGDLLRDCVADYRQAAATPARRPVRAG